MSAAYQVKQAQKQSSNQQGRGGYNNQSIQRSIGMTKKNKKFQASLSAANMNMQSQNNAVAW